MNLNHWADGAWADGSWVAAAWGVAGVQPRRRPTGGWWNLPAERWEVEKPLPPPEEETAPQTTEAAMPSGSASLPVKSAEAVLIKPIVIDVDSVRKSARNAALDEVQLLKRRKRRREAEMLLLLS